MQTFLEQPEATFYHITTAESWECIKQTGLISTERKIFVSRIGELPVLLAIAFEQLPEIYTTNTEAIVFLKLPQSKNNFTLNEIVPDRQAGVEWTQPFQNIILRQTIPFDNLELMMKIRLGQGEQRDFNMSYLAQIANTGQQDYALHSITNRASQLSYK